MDSNSFFIVTGGSGFIGSAIVWKLNEMGYDNILIIDRLGKDNIKWKNLSALKFIDILDADSFLKMIKKETLSYKIPKIIFHLGACSSTTETDVNYLLENNFEYTKVLCNWAIKNNSKFVYASSAATYGDGENGMLDENDDIHKLRPLNAYGFSKNLFDHYALNNGIMAKIVGLKYFNVFGPNENHKKDMRSLANKAYKQIRDTNYINLFKSYKKDFADGEQKRDFLYIKDAVKMTIHLAFLENSSGLYNLGSGKASSWNQMASALFKALGKKEDIKYIEMPEQLRDKYQYFTKANINKLLETNYVDEITSLDKAIEDYVKNYLMKDKYLGD